MTNFIIGAIFGIVALLLCIYIIGKIDDRRIRKEIGEDYETVFIPKSKMKMIDLSIGQEFNLDGYDIIIDPYILAPEGKIRVIVNKDNEHKIIDIDRKEIKNIIFQ